MVGPRSAEALVIRAILALTVILPISAQTDQALFAANIANVSDTGEPFPFHSIFVIRGPGLDQPTWTLSIASTGLYLSTLTAGHTGEDLTDYRLVKDGTRIGALYRTASPNNMTDTMGLDVVRSFYKDELTYISSTGPALASTPEGLHTSWGIFSLSGEMAADVGFGVARASPYHSGRIPFDINLGEVGNGWDGNNHQFQAPKAGIYFFSFSAGTTSGNNIDVYLAVNGQYRYHLYRSQPTSVTTDTMARSVLIRLNQGDQVYLYNNYYVYSDSRLLTSFSGFLYNTDRDRHMAWSVYDAHSVYCGPYDPFPFNYIEVNHGEAYINHRVRCPWSGLYYVHLSAGVYPGNPVLMYIMKGDEIQGELRREGPLDRYDLISRSLLVYCLTLEEIRIVLPSGSCAYGGGSSNQRRTSFSGFYIFS